MTPPVAPRLTRRSVFYLGCLLCLLVFQGTLFAADIAVRSFDVPAGPAADTLNRYAQQANREIMFPADSVAGVKTNPLKGSYTPREAIDLMIAHTGLVVVEDAGTGAMMIGLAAKKPSTKPSPEIGVKSKPPPQKMSLFRNSLHKFAALTPFLIAALNAQSPATNPTADAADSSVLRLDEFTVASTAGSGYRATNSISASGIGTPIGDTPSTVEVVTKDFISDLRLDLVNDALRYVPGVVTGPNNESQPFIRGFQGTYTLRNGVFRRQNLTTWNIDSVEVLQGPSSIFYSNIRPGGVINYNTVKPVFGQDFVDTTVDFGTYGYRRGEAAFNAGNDSLAVRVDIGSLNFNSFRLSGNEQQKFLSLGIKWQVTPNQVITLEGDTESVSRVNSWTSYVVPLTNSRYWQNPAAIASGQSVSAWMAANFPGTPVYDEFAPFAPSAGDQYGRVTPIMSTYQSGLDKPIDLSYTAKITDSLVFSAILNYAWEDNEGINPVLGDPLANGTFTNVVAQRFVNIRDSYNANTRLTYRFKLLGAENTLMAGNDNQWVIKRVPQVASLNVSTTPGIANTVSGNNQNSASFTYVPGVTPEANGQALIGTSPTQYNAIQDTLQDFSGTYLVDQSVFLNDSLFVVAGVRFANFKQQVYYHYRPDLASGVPPNATAKKTTPQVGALYKLVKGLSIYATYAEAIQPQTQVDASGMTVKPQDSTGWDVGTKLDLFGGALTGTVDYYETKQTNTAIADSARDLANGLPSNATYGYYTYGNAQQVKGLQGELNYSVTQDYQLVLGVNEFYEAAYVAPQSNSLNIGAAISYQPATMYNVWNRYEVSSGAFKGLILGGGFHHNSRAAYGGDFNHSYLTIPSFTVFDAMIGYDFKAFGHKVSAKVLGKNLGDKIYRDQSGYFNNPRTVQVSLSARF